MAVLDHATNAALQIMRQHHPYARRALPYIVPLLARVAGFHGKRNGKLGPLCDAGTELADALEAHVEEEQAILSAILDAPGWGGAVGGPARGCQHRVELARLLGRVRELADGYATPEWGSLAYRALMEELEALDEDLAEYLHLEEFVVAPRLALR
jgi:iron-sulfur cluster repair protein YtfE (RIC family)